MRELEENQVRRPRATPPPPPPARQKERFSETMWFKLGEVDDWREHESVSDFDKPRELAERYAAGGVASDDRGLYSLGARGATGRSVVGKTRDYLRSSIPRSAAPRRVLLVLTVAACAVGVTQFSQPSHALEAILGSNQGPVDTPAAPPPTAQDVETDLEEAAPADNGPTKLPAAMAIRRSRPEERRTSEATRRPKPAVSQRQPNRRALAKRRPRAQVKHRAKPAAKKRRGNTKARRKAAKNRRRPGANRRRTGRARR